MKRTVCGVLLALLCLLTACTPAQTPVGAAISRPPLTEQGNRQSGNGERIATSPQAAPRNDTADPPATVEMPDPGAPLTEEASVGRGLAPAADPAPAPVDAPADIAHAPSNQATGSQTGDVGIRSPIAEGAGETGDADCHDQSAAWSRNDTGSKTPATLTCTISITCETLLADPERCAPAKRDLIPPDGILLTPTELELREGETAFNLLQRVCRQNGIHLEFAETPLYDSVYVEGIGNLYEFDAGELSGWMFSVNGVFPNYGCGQVALKPGDTVCWRYTCELGRDIGGSGMGGAGT